MIGSCASCLYTRIEIRCSCFPPSRTVKLPALLPKVGVGESDYPSPSQVPRLTFGRLGWVTLLSGTQTGSPTHSIKAFKSIHCPSLLTLHLRLSTLKCHNTEVAITVRAEKDRSSIGHMIALKMTKYLRDVLSEVSEVVDPQPSIPPPWSTMSMSPISSRFGM